MEAFVAELVERLVDYGFRQVPRPSEAIPGAQALLRRQTLNMNRAVLVVFPAFTPPDFPSYVKEVRRQAAFRCRFLPFLWGIGLQVVIVLPGIAKAGIDPTKYVSKSDNQWAIIQSVFLIDPTESSFVSARTWGQVVTGKYQDAIENVLASHFSRRGE